MPQDPLHLLCIEPRFPGRLGPVADWLVRRRGYRCQFYCHTAEAREHWPNSVGRGLDVVPFNVGGVAREASVAWHRSLERGLCYAYGCWEVLEMRRPKPVDLILGRSAGLGSTLFAAAYLPGVPVVNLFDGFLHPHKHDLADNAKPDTAIEYYHWRRAANSIDLLDLENGIHAWTPTTWQRDLYPAEYRGDFKVQFDGVDTRRFQRRLDGRRSIAGRDIPPETRVVSFVAHSLDKLRGFDRFMELAKRLLKASPEVLCVVAGGPIVNRGLDVEHYQRDYRKLLLSQTPVHDPNRLWFLDQVTPAIVAELLNVSDLHVYPSRSFAVARSLVEAMASGCVVLAWDTPPVREFITDQQSGLLLSPDDPEGAERTALAVLSEPAKYRPLGEEAARSVRERFSQEVTLPQLATWFDELVAARGW